MSLLLALTFVTINVSSVFALFGGDESRCQWRNLPTGTNYWVGGQRVSFQYKFNRKPVDPQQVFFTIDSVRHWKKDLQAATVVGPDSDLWYSASATIPNTTKTDYRWQIKIENRLFGKDICESPDFRILAFWDANDKSKPVSQNKLDITPPEIQTPDKPDVQSPSKPNVEAPTRPQVQTPSMVAFAKVSAVSSENTNE